MEKFKQDKVVNVELFVSNETPYTWNCGTPARLGDVVEYDTYTGVLYWSDYFKTYEVSVGTHLTLNEDSINDFRFIRRGF